MIRICGPVFIPPLSRRCNNNDERCAEFCAGEDGINNNNARWSQVSPAACVTTEATQEVRAS